jgi:hypothetical protein
VFSGSASGKLSSEHENRKERENNAQTNFCIFVEKFSYIIEGIINNINYFFAKSNLNFHFF